MNWKSALATLIAVISLVATGSAQSQYYNGTEFKRVYPPDSDEVPSPFLAPLFYEGQLCHWVRAIFQDSSGNLWFGTNHYGVMCYDGDTLEYFAADDGVVGGRISGIVEDQDGSVWFATTGGLTRYDGQSFTHFSFTDGTIDNDVWCVTIDRHGLFWIGTSHGAYQFDGKSFTPFPIPKAEVRDTASIISYERVSSIAEDSHGNMWFGTDGFGICIYDGNAFTRFTTDDGLCDNNVSGLMEDSRGHMWIGTMFGGVCRYDGESFTNYTGDGVIAGVEAGAFFEDKDGTIWFAAEHHGVYRFDGQSFTNLYEDEGLETGGVLSILKDREGRFWFGGWKGLFRYDGNSFFPVLKSGPWN